MRQTGNLSIFLLFAAGTVFAGCNPIYYSPNTQNVLMPAAPEDVAIAGMTDGNRIEIQGAYAVTDAVTLQLNGGLFDRNEKDNDDGGAGHFIELGAGYVQRPDENLSWEILGLLGVGSAENDFPSTVEANPGTTGELRADLVRFGVQPALGYRSKYFEVAGSSRVVGLAYRNVEGSLMYAGEDQVALLRDADRYFLVEPALTLRAGLENVKLQIQAARSFNLTDSDFRQDESMFTVGVVVGLARRR